MSTQPNNNRRRRLGAAAGFAIFAIAGGSLAANYGLMTDTERVKNNLFQAGDADSNLDLTVTQQNAFLNGDAVAAGASTGVMAWDGVTAGQNSDTNTAGQIRLNVPNMAPGDLWKYDLVVANVGDVHELRYNAESVLTEAAATAGALAAADDGDASDSTAAGAPTTMGLEIRIKDSGGNLVASNVSSDAIPFNIGDVTVGAQAGDRVLAPNANETLTVEVQYPASAASTSFGATADFDMTFHSEQTANNP